MAGVTIEVVKRINFDKKAWDMMKKLSEISTTRGEQMTDAVMANIIRHDNIDTGTLIDNLKTEKQLDPKEMSIETSSDVSSHPEGNICLLEGQESSPCMGQNLPTSKKEKKKTDSSQNNRRENARRCFGQYRNVFLLDSELADLQSTYPGQYEDYINRLSAYMASSGKHYANHYATIRKWLDEDSKSKPGKNYDYTETYEEGECL